MSIVMFTDQWCRFWMILILQLFSVRCGNVYHIVAVLAVDHKIFRNMHRLPSSCSLRELCHG